jgi:hypothetical protein
MKIYKIDSYDSYKRFQENTKDEYIKHIKYLSSTLPKTASEFTTYGYSYTAGKYIQFTNDFKYSPDFPNVNWRERVVCPITGLNNRTRAAIHIFDIFSNTFYKDNIYIMEQTTPLYNYMKSKYYSLIGSEYLNNETPLGEVNAKGIRNEDATKLSFDTNSIKAVLSFDVFEHVYEYNLAFNECYRVLELGGSLIFTVPFDTNQIKNTERAKILKNGYIKHILPAEYHGDPMSEGGVLCFRHYGWKILKDLKKCGFKEAFALIFNSEKFGYYENQIIFYCKK